MQGIQSFRTPNCGTQPVPKSSGVGGQGRCESREETLDLPLEDEYKPSGEETRWIIIFSLDRELAFQKSRDRSFLGFQTPE